MTFLLILFLSPVYFLVRGKMGAFMLNSILYGAAVICILSIVGIPVAPLFWLLAVGHAAFHNRREAMNRHAELIATKMAEKMKQ